MTKRQAQPSPPRRASAASRTSHQSPLLLLAAALVALISTALLLLPHDAPSPPPTTAAQHMQHVLHRAAAPLRNAPLVSRIVANRPQQPIYSSSSSSSSSSSRTMSSSTNKPVDTVDTDTFHPRAPADPNDNDAPPRNGGAPLPLPAPEDAEAIKLDMSKGDGIRLDALGPLVVNEDGTLSRIANWEKMAEIEKRNTLRVLGKRNKERLAKLRGEEGQGGEPGEQK